MSDDKRRKEYFVKIANQFVKKEIRKRRVLQMTFSDAEMKEVEELKEFLVNIVTDNTDPMLLAYEGYTRYIGISFKVTLSNGLSTFVNVFYDVKDLDYAKDKLYVAKGIYKLSQNKHIETFFCTSLLRIKGKSRFGFYAPERRRENASSVSSIYIDLDLPSHLKGLDKEEVFKLIENECGEVFHYLGGSVVISGGGFHVYFRIETTTLEDVEIQKRWKAIQSDMASLFRDFGADLKCVGDLVRVLRVPHSYNRKYGPKGYKVKILKKDYKINSLEEVEQVIDYLLVQGGKQGFYNNILDDIIPVPKQNADFVDLGDIDIGIFDDEPTEYTAPQYIKQMALRQSKKEEPTISKDSKEPPRKAEELSEKTDIDSYYESFQGIKTDYDSFYNGEFFQIRDVLFFLNNRKYTNGVRHTTIFIIGYSWFYFKGVRNEKEFVKKCLWLNNFFKPQFPEDELIYQAKENFKYIQRLGYREKYISSETIDRIYKPTREEKICVRGNYFCKDSPEYLEKKRTEHAKYNLSYYHRINGYKRKEIEDRHQKAKEYISKHPDIGVTKACKSTGISATMYYAIVKELNITKVDYDTPFLNNKDITYNEFYELTKGSRNTYYRHKKKHTH